MDLCFDVYCGRSMLPATQNIVRRRVHWLCETSPEGLILDLGCSQGLEALILAYLGKDVIGLDNDALALDWAQRNVLRYPEDIQKRITFVHEDFSLWTTPLHFDGIIAGEYLEHLTDSQLKQHLSKIASLLKEHGKFLCTVPLGRHPHPDHHQTFFPRNFIQLLEPLFSIEYMDVKDGNIYCIALSKNKNKATTIDSMALLEKGLYEYQQAMQSRTPAKVDGSEQKYLPFIQGKGSLESGKAQTLSNYLEQQGFIPPYIYDGKLFSCLNRFYGYSRALKTTPYSSSKETVAEKLQRYYNQHGGTWLQLGYRDLKTSQILARDPERKIYLAPLSSKAKCIPEQNIQTLPGTIQNLKLRPQSIDVIFTEGMLDHENDPRNFLKKIYMLLKPGGILYASMHLYRGAGGSHRGREVLFPWPQLLFDENIFAAYYREQGYEGAGLPARLNYFTLAQYKECFAQQKFIILESTTKGLPFDQDFFTCFENRLGRYPIEDLKTDFLEIIAQKKI